MNKGFGYAIREGYKSKKHSLEKEKALQKRIEIEEIQNYEDEIKNAQR